MKLRLLPLLPLVIAAAVASGRDARADEGGQKFTDVPLTLKPLHFAADAAIGFGTYEANGGSHVGAGSNFDAAIGLPFLGEFGADIAQRFGNDGVAVGAPIAGPSGADHFARLFDPVLTEPGSADFANPEF